MMEFVYLMLLILWFWFIVRIFVRISKPLPKIPVEPSCPPHNWEHHEGKGHFCTICKQYASYQGRS